VVTLVAALSGSRADALGALVGGSIAWCFFLFGSLVVETATRMAPSVAMLMALMTYTLQVLLVALVFALLKASGAVDTTLTGTWLAAGVVGATLAWTIGQLVASSRARVPAYDIELPGPRPSTSDASATSTSDPGDRTSSSAREVGAP
jgi:ATP synthase protein I